MAYKISLSNKTDVQIDQDELQTVQDGIQSGARLIKVRSAMFNPSFIVSIEPDHKRLEGMKYLPEKLPDLFNRIGKMVSMEEINQMQINAPKEPEISKEEMRHMLDKYKPEFLKEDAEK